MPRKTFSDGDALPASDLNTYLMDQSVQTYSSATDRTADLPTPADGQVTTLATDKNLQTYYGQYRPLPFAMQQGLVSITPVANVATGVAVTFATGRFSLAPYVFTTAQSGVTQITNTAATSSSSGATIVLLATNTTARNVQWMAVQMLDNNAAG